MTFSSDFTGHISADSVSRRTSSRHLSTDRPKPIPRLTPHSALIALVQRAFSSKTDNGRHFSSSPTTGATQNDIQHRQNIIVRSIANPEQRFDVEEREGVATTLLQHKYQYKLNMKNNISLENKPLGSVSPSDAVSLCRLQSSS